MADEGEVSLQVRAFRAIAEALTPEELQERLQALNEKPFRAQAQWFLNAFWECPPYMLKDKPFTCEEVYQIMAKCIELSPDGDAGTKLRGIKGAQLAEAFGEAMSVSQLRQALREVDIDAGQGLTLAEFLVFHFSVDWHYLVVARSNDKSRSLVAAQRKVAEARVAMDAATGAEDAARQELAASEAAEAQAVAERVASENAVADSQQATARVAEAEAEQNRALEELELQQKAQEDRIAELEARAEDESLSVLQRSLARNKLNQELRMDMQPLKQATLEQAATLRSFKKSVRGAAQMEHTATTSVASAEEAVAKAARVRIRAARAADIAHQRTGVAAGVMREAVAALEEVVSEKTGDDAGSIWMMNYELEDARTRMPNQKSFRSGGLARAQVA